VRQKRQKRQKPPQATLTGGLVLSKLSKVLNQGHALGVPCLRRDFWSLRKVPGGALESYGKAASVASDVTIAFVDYLWVILASADAFPVLGSRCMGRARRCRAGQGHRDKMALTYEYLLPR
jgi:hypothetical protein